MAPEDLSILQEIVKAIQAQSKVPEHVRISKREYVITYLEDHRQRLEEALRRNDRDRLNMLFGQLASKVKYQLVRRVAARGRERTRAKPARGRTSTTRGSPSPSKAGGRGSRARGH